MDSVHSNRLQGSSPSSVRERGEYSVDIYLEELGADGVVITVLEIGHYRQPFQPSIRGSDLLHDLEFVGLRVRVGRREKLIKAEKFAGNIEISNVEIFETNGAEIKHGPVEVEDYGEIVMGDLLAILKEHIPDYYLLSDNCWEYADSTFRRLIRNFSAHPTISPERTSEREGFLNHPAPTMLDFGSVSIWGARILDGLRSVASIFDRVHAVSEVAVKLFPPEQLAKPSVTRVQGGMHTITRMQARAPAALHQILSAPQTIQAIARAQSLAQTMRPA